MSLRVKLTIALLLISLATAASVGGFAYGLLMWDFRQSIENRAFEHFQADMAAYIGTYGSWARAVRSEPFPEFVRRRRVADHRPFPPPRDPSGRMIPRPGQAPFHFLLLDAQGRVLLPLGPYRIGQAVPQALLKKARPIKVGDRVAVLAEPIGAPIMTDADRAYLALTQRALAIGVLAAALLAVLTGLFLSRRMSAALGEVTDAVRSMQPDGELRLSIPVRSRDEIGVLATALNRMSAKLADAHQTVKSQAEELLQLSIRDPLTDLYNRRHFDEQAAVLYQQAIRHRRPLTLVLLDLDHFKQVNDLHSHAVGDEVLRRVARMLKEHMRASDVIARYGGEEFVIACPDSALPQTAQRCDDLRRRIEAHPWQELAPDLRVTASMGMSDAVALDSVEAMLAEADAQLYQAKHAGRNRIMPEPAQARPGGA